MSALQRAWHRRIRSGASDERGSALLIALVMIFVVSIVATAVLTYTGTSLTTTKSVGDDRKSLYAADGALDTAIKKIGGDANGGYYNTDSLCSQSPTPTSDPRLTTEINGSEAKVVCQGVNPKVSSGTGTGDNQSDAPANAVLTLGQNANQPAASRTSDQCGLFWWTRPDRDDKVVEPGTYFAPSPSEVDLLAALFNNPPCGYTAYKQSQPVKVAGGIIANSTVVGKGDQSLTATGPIKVRQACAFTGTGQLVSSSGSGAAACDVLGYDSTDHDFDDPGYFHKGETQGFPAKPAYTNNPDGQGNPGTLPACGTSTLVTFLPGWYDNAEALNNLFRTCANADGSGKDYWFVPGVYYFDFRNTTVTQGCGDVGVNSDPGVFDFGDEDLAKLTHQWCIRGKNVSDGATANQKRPHIIGGTPMGTEADPDNPGSLRCKATAPTCWNPLPAPITALLQAATATSPASDFQNAQANARTINGSSATASWTGATTNQTLGSSSTSQTSGGDDFSPKVNATGAINGTTANHTAASFIGSIVASLATSSQVSGADDFANKANGRVIDGSASSATIQSQSQNQAPGSATSSQIAQPGTDDFTPRANATGLIDGSIASHVLASITAALTAASATSTTVSGGQDFPNADPNAITINDGQTTSETLASTTLRVDPTAAVTSTISGGPDFTPIGNLTNISGSPIDGTTASHTLQAQNATMHSTDASSSTVSGSDDFSNETDAEGAPDGNTATATFGTSTVTLEPATGNESGADFSPTANARSINSQFATLALSGTSSGDIELNGYPNVPGSSAPSAITINVAHFESSTANLTLTASLRDSDGSLSGNCNNLPVSGSTTSSNVTPVTVPANCVSAIDAGEADDLQVLFNASKSGGTGSRTISLDGISIAVTTNDTAQRTLTMSSPAPQIPAGATINSVSLSITHSESANSGQSVVVTPGGAGACSAVNLTQRASLTTDTVSLSGCTLNTLARVNGMSVAYRATAPAPGTQTARVDAITITVNYTDPANRFATWTMGTGVSAASALDSAVLSVRHQETGASLNPRLVITPGNTSTPCATVNLTTRAALTTDTVDVRASGCLNSAVKLNGAKVQYLVNITGSSPGTATLDGAIIDVITTDPTARGVTLNSLTAAPPVPTGGTLESAVLSVRHQETGSGLSPRLVVTPGNTATPCATVNLTTRASLTTDTVDVRASGCLDTPAELNGAKVQYLVNLTPNGAQQSGVATLDGMRIDVLSTNTAARTITLSSPAPTIPAGTSLDSATLSVRHQETAGNLNPRLVITAPGGGCTQALTTQPTLGTQTFDAKTIGGGTCLNTAAKLNGATYQYVVNLTANGAAQNATASLDAVNVAVQTTDTANRFLQLATMSPSVPTAAVVETATLSVAHQEVGSGLSPRIVITPGGGGTCTFNLPTRATLGTDPAIDVKSCLNTPAKINGATAQYVVNLAAPGASQNGTASLDGLRIDVLATDSTNRSITLSSPTPAAPSAGGTIVTSVGVTIAHAETGAGLNPRLVITPGGAAACAAIPLATQPTLTNQTIDATSCLNTPAKVNGATYQYLVNLTANGSAQSGTANVDAVQVAVATTNGTTKTITLSAFGAALPASATNLSSVTIDVAHTETAGTNPRLVVTAGGGGSQTYPLGVRSTLGTDTIDVSGLLTTAAKVNGAQVQFLADPPAGASGTASLDGVNLNAGYRPAPGRAPVLGANAAQSTVATPLESPPACDEKEPGVQWIFGGDSRIYQPDATVEICAGPSTGDPEEQGFSAQQIAVYGLKPTPAMRPGAATDATGAWQNAADALAIGESPSLKTASLVGSQGGSATLAPATTNEPPAPGNSAFTNPDRAYVIQGGTSDNDAARFSGNQYAQLVLGGYPTVPAAAVPTDVRLNVRHKESTSSTSNIGTLKVNVLPPTGTTPLCTADLRSPNNLSTSYASDQFNLTSCLNTAAKINGVRLSYEAKSSNSTSRDFFLDGLSLTVTYNLSGSITLDGFNGTDIPAGLKVKNVTARVSHLETGTSFTSDQRPTVAFTNGAGESCGGATTLTTFQRSFWDIFNFFSRDEDGPVAEPIDLTSCFNGANSATRLSGASATFTGTVKANQAENLDGIELIVTFEPITPSTEVFVPESGCLTSLPKYEHGYGDPDCALWKWDSAEYRRSVFGFGWNTINGRPNGQTSIRGTVYAPGAAIDLDDQGARTALSTSGCNTSSSTSVGSACYTGVNYPIFGRGIIARHLRFKGFKLATGYDKAIARCGDADCAGGVNNNIPQPKKVVLTASVEDQPRITATVCFDAAASGPCVAPAASGNRARILNWNVVK